MRTSLLAIFLALSISACGDDDVSRERDADSSVSTTDSSAPEVLQPIDGGPWSPEAGLDGGLHDAEALAADSGPHRLSDVIAVSMRERTAFTLGGATVEYWPNFLFADGSACTDDQFVARGLSADEHRARYPKNWTTWSEQNGNISIEDPSKPGARVALMGKYMPFPAGTTLHDSYSYLTGGGTALVGGDTLVFAQSTLRFFADGVFASGSFAGVNSSSLVAVKAPADQRGTYTIEGFLLTLRFDDGSQRLSSIVFGTKEPIEVIWLGSKAYISDSAL